ncbi:MAG: PAS domain S-box protein, partial [Planctomycetes bacterium]|nr:PAS domain S-box protein [Planctomycetota bacterium]
PTYEELEQRVKELEQTEKSLEESEETYRNIFINSQIGLFRTDSVTGTIFDVNDALAHLAGFKDREELLENNWNIAEHYVDTNRRQEIIEKLVEYGSFNNEEALFVNHLKEYKWLRLSCILTDKGVVEGVAEDI